MTVATMSTYAPSFTSRMNNLSLRHKLLILLLVLVISAVSIVAFFANNISSEALTTQLGDNLHLLGRSNADSITEVLDAVMVDEMIGLRLNKLIQDELDKQSSSYTGDETTIRANLETANKRWQAASSNDLMVTSVLHNTVADELAEYRQSLPNNIDIFLTDRYGAVASATNRPDQFYQAREDWWQAAWNDGKGEIYIGQMTYDKSINDYVMLVAVPIFQHDTAGEGRIVGILRTLYRTGKIQSIVNDFSIGTTGRAYLLTKDDTYIAQSNPTPLSLSSSTLQALSTIPQDKFGRINFEGHDSLVAQIPISDEGNESHINPLRWKLVIVQDTAEALASVSNVTSTIVIIGLLVAGLAALVATFMAQQIVKPINLLTEAAAQIEQGNFETEIAIQSTDEVGLLANTFRSMSQQLSGTIETLKAATKAAQESARLKSEFLSTMSHELRTPLNAIQGFTGIILEGMGGVVDSEAEDMLKRIESNSHRLLGLINEVLDLAKIEAGRMELVNVPVNPNTLVNSWKSQMAVLAEKKNLTFDVKVDPSLPTTLYCDPDRVTQIAINLLSNAFKFTSSGSVSLGMQLQNNQWIIQVKDTGIGIPPHAINYIFDEFRQVDGSSRRIYGGSGLGLAIVRNLCRMMGGTIRVTSELGKGSVFTATFPLVTQPQNKSIAFEMA